MVLQYKFLLRDSENDLLRWISRNILLKDDTFLNFLSRNLSSRSHTCLFSIYYYFVDVFSAWDKFQRMLTIYPQIVDTYSSFFPLWMERRKWLHNLHGFPVPVFHQLKTIIGNRITNGRRNLFRLVRWFWDFFCQYSVVIPTGSFQQMISTQNFGFL